MKAGAYSIPSDKPVPHPHSCSGCGNEWLCQNSSCGDPRVKWCRRWCTAYDQTRPLVARTEALQDAGHLLHQAAFVVDQAGGGEAVDKLAEARAVILAEIAAIDAQLTADLGLAPLGAPA